jgi:UDP-glucose 4-epimerase
MPKEKILVTGGLGFIGSHTAVELLNEGYEVVIVDDLSNSQLFILDNIEKIAGKRPAFYQVNMQNKVLLEKVFQSEPDIKAVIHFAAFKAVGESVAEPLKYFQNNLVSLLNLLQCMKDYSVENIVFSSSATVYGMADEFPIVETSPFKKALSAYGSTKQMGEEIIEKVSATGTLKAIVLRYFNPVGAHPSALLGELPIGVPNNLMPFITQTAAGLRSQLTVHGNDYDTPDGTCLRDYIHVVDLAIAHVKSCDKLMREPDNAPYNVYNIGTGKAISVLEMIKTFEQCNGLKLNYTIGPRRLGDVTAIYADASKAARGLHWEANLGLTEMVTSAWKWQTNLLEIAADK